MRKVCVITGTRAEYGLLYWLLKLLENDKEVTLQLIVTGSHLSKQHGETVNFIENDGFKITKKIDILLSNDSRASICKSMSLAMLGFSDAYEAIKPDLLILLGDRYEIFCAASAAQIYKLPIAHIHGGELTLGAMDDAFRHSITKMSHLHFTSTLEYKKRIHQLGEDPKNTFHVGPLGNDNLKRCKLLNKKEFEQSIQFKLKKKNFLITFHPETLNQQSPSEQMKELLDAVSEYQEYGFIFTMPNADTHASSIKKLIADYVKKFTNHAVAFSSLGQLRYVSALKIVDGVIGNSSSGIIEAPYFAKPTINIGIRQEGRIQSNTTYNCPAKKSEISKKIKFITTLNKSILKKNLKNPYSKMNASEQIYKVLKKKNFSCEMVKKFYDIF